MVLEMGQKEIIDYLKKHPEDWISRDELQRVIGCGEDSVVRCLRTLVRSGEVERRFELVQAAGKPTRRRVITWVKLTSSYKRQLKEEGLL